jgi:hypothetical protein
MIIILRTPYQWERRHYRVCYVCFGCNNGTPTEKPDSYYTYLTQATLHLPDTSNQDRLETKDFHDVCLASCMTCWAVPQRHINEIKFSNTEWVWKHLTARFQVQIVTFICPPRNRGMMIDKGYIATLLRAQCSWNTPPWSPQMEIPNPQTSKTGSNQPSQHVWWSSFDVSISLQMV